MWVVEKLVTDEMGNRVFAAAYDPYGGIQKIWENSYSPALKFSGKERDSESNLDYFGARYYANFHYRWLSPDPVINRDAALMNPQLWNLYSFCRNNPVSYWDPDGAEVYYQTNQLKTFFMYLKSKSRMVAATLALYEGPSNPDLRILHDNAGFDVDGEKALGSFVPDIGVDYGENISKIRPGMELEQIEELGTWYLKSALLIIDKSLTIDRFNKETVKTALHELGHADQAIRQPLQFLRDARNIRTSEGKIIKHEERPAEAYANRYQKDAIKEVMR